MADEVQKKPHCRHAANGEFVKQEDLHLPPISQHRKCQCECPRNRSCEGKPRFLCIWIHIRHSTGRRCKNQTPRRRESHSNTNRRWLHKRFVSQQDSQNLAWITAAFVPEAWGIPPMPRCNSATARPCNMCESGFSRIKALRSGVLVTGPDRKRRHYIHRVKTRHTQIRKMSSSILSR